MSPSSSPKTDYTVTETGDIEIKISDFLLDKETLEDKTVVIEGFVYDNAFKSDIYTPPSPYDRPFGIPGLDFKKDISLKVNNSSRDIRKFLSGAIFGTSI